jgi:hypothetical protein
MIALKGIYELGEFKLIDAPPSINRSKVIITFLDDSFDEFLSMPFGFLDDLIGVVSEKKDGSVNHDSYLNSTI